jgi:hypothetical protein
MFVLYVAQIIFNYFCQITIYTTYTKITFSWQLWGPPTKQFCSKCQSPRVLLSSQSAWSIAAPSCIGSRPASLQTIRDGHPERQVSAPAALLSATKKWEPACIEKLRLLASRLQERTRHFKATRTNRPDHRPVETTPFFIQSGTTKVVLPIPATSSGPFKVYNEHSVWRAWSRSYGEMLVKMLQFWMMESVFDIWGSKGCPLEVCQMGIVLKFVGYWIVHKYFYWSDIILNTSSLITVLGSDKKK